MGELIRVKQLPVIEEELRAMKAQVEAKVAEAVSLVCTPETIQAVKAVRAGLRKEFEALEGQRAAVKKAVMGPYHEFERVYKDCISEPFKRADADLKGKVEATEAEIKGACEAGLRAYFQELCQVYGVDFVPFERTGIAVDLASAKAKTPTKLRKQLTQFVEQVAVDMDVLSEMEDGDEILAEFKRTLDATGAISAVRVRHERIQAEREARAAREERRRREAAVEARVTEAAQASTVEEAPALVGEDAPPQEAATDEAEIIYRCTFTVDATKGQLKKLKEFLESEGIPYE